MRSWGRLVMVVIAAAILGLGAGAVFSHRSDPPPLSGPVVIDPVDSTTAPPSLTPSSPGSEEPTAEPVLPRVIDDDEDDDGGYSGSGE
jgi:hypothetical protein